MAETYDIAPFDPTVKQDDDLFDSAKETDPQNEFPIGEPTAGFTPSPTPVGLSAQHAAPAPIPPPDPFPFIDEPSAPSEAELRDAWVKLQPNGGLDPETAKKHGDTLRRGAEAEQNERLAKQKEDFKGRYRTPDGVLEMAKDPTVRREMDASPDDDLVIKRALNRNYLATTYGKPNASPEELDQIMRAHSITHWGINNPSHDTFYSRTRDDVLKSDEDTKVWRSMSTTVAQKILEDQLAGKQTSFSETFEKFATANPKVITAQNKDEWYMTGLLMDERLRKLGENVRFPASQLIDIAGKVTDGTATELDWDRATNALRGVNPTDLEQVLKVASIAVREQDPKGEMIKTVAGNIGKRFDRDFNLSKVYEQDRELLLNDQLKNLEAGMTIGKDKNGRLVFAQPGQPLPEFAVQLDQAEYNQYWNDAHRAMDGMAIARVIQQFQEQVADPVVPYFKGGLLGAAEAGAYDIAGFSKLIPLGLIPGPAGLLTMAKVVSASTYHDIRLENPDLPIEAARDWANVDGVFNSVGMKFKTDFLLGRYPFFTSVRQLKGAGRSIEAVMVYGRWAAVHNLEENFEELAQDTLSASLAKLYGDAYPESMKQQTWGDMLVDIARTRPQVAMAVGPLSLIGAGQATVRDLRNPMRDFMNPDALKSVGLSDEKVAEVLASKDLDEAQKIFRKHYNTLTKEDLKRGFEYAAGLTEKDEVDEAMADPAMPTIDPVVMPDGSYKYNVLAPDGTVLSSHTDPDVAETAWVRETERVKGEHWAAEQNAAAQQAAAEAAAAASDEGVAKEAEAKATAETVSPEDRLGTAMTVEFEENAAPTPEESGQVAQLQADVAAQGRADVIVLARPSDAQAGPGQASLNFIRAFERATGKRVVFVASGNDQPLSFTGAVRKGDPNTIFLDAHGDRNVLALVGHEWSHTLEQTSPELHAEMIGRMKPLIIEWAKQEGILAKEVGVENVTNEMVANIVGDAISNENFWTVLAQKNPSLFEKVRDAVLKFLDQFIGKVQKSEFGTEAFITDVAQMREIVADIMDRAGQRMEAAPAGAGVSFAPPRPVRSDTREKSVAGYEFLKEITRPNHSYRGMTAAEYNATVAKGAGVKSSNAYSLPGEGTSFGADAGTAESYINFGKDDPRTTGETTYLVEVGNKGLEVNRQGYLYAFQAVPQSQITRVLEMTGEGDTIMAREIPIPEPSPRHEVQFASRRTEKGFYSKLEGVVVDKIPKTASPDQVKATINGAGIKAEEIKWSGVMPTIDKLAAENQGKVPKEKLVAHLEDEGSVKFEEVTLAEETSNAKEIEQAKRHLNEITEEMYGLMQRMAAVEDKNSDIHKSLMEEWLQVSYRQEEARTQLGKLQIVEKKERPRFNRDDLILPGGENYREVVLAMPGREQTFEEFLESSSFAKGVRVIEQQASQSGQDPTERINNLREQVRREFEAGRNIKRVSEYTSSHFPDVPNYVAHMRLNEREGGLFIEEIQSDRHQQAREKGYAEPVDAEQLAKANRVYDAFRRSFPEYRKVEQETGLTYAQALEIRKESVTKGQGIPDAPFRKDWHLAMFKRALRDAVATGKEWIGWTTGETQAERYDLSKQVQLIRAIKDASGNFELRAIDINGRDIELGTVGADKLPDTIGKDLANKVVQQPPGEIVDYTGENLKIGGEGMKGFYDKMLPNEVGKYVKQWGSKVEEGELDIGRRRYQVRGRKPDGEWQTGGYFTSAEEAQSQLETFRKNYPSEEWEINKLPGEAIWKVEITPQMKAGVTEGQVMFAGRRKTEPSTQHHADIVAAHDASVAAMNGEGGGSTVNAVHGSLVGTKNYSVAVFPELSTQIPGKSVTAEQIAELAAKAKSMRIDTTGERISIGTWYDKENDTTWLDVVMTTADRERALDLAKQYNQKAIFDLENIEEITTGGTGEMVGGLPPIKARIEAINNPTRFALAELEQFAKDNEDFKNWYDEFSRFLDDFLKEYPEYKPIVSEFLAATSANTPLKKNVESTIENLRSFILEGKFVTKFEAHLPNLGRATRGEKLQGPKIGEFSGAVFGDVNSIAIDTHMAQIIFGARRNDKGQIIGPTDAQIRVGKEVVRQIASRLGWTPAQAQAALWAANLKLIGKYDPNYRYERYLEEHRQELFNILAQDRAGEGRGREASRRIGERIREGAGTETGAGSELGGETQPRANTAAQEAISEGPPKVQQELGQLAPPQKEARITPKKGGQVAFAGRRAAAVEAEIGARTAEPEGRVAFFQKIRDRALALIKEHDTRREGRLPPEKIDPANELARLDNAVRAKMEGIDRREQAELDKIALRVLSQFNAPADTGAKLQDLENQRQSEIEAAERDWQKTFSRESKNISDLTFQQRLVTFERIRGLERQYKERLRGIRNVYRERGRALLQTVATDKAAAETAIKAETRTASEVEKRFDVERREAERQHEMRQKQIEQRAELRTKIGQQAFEAKEARRRLIESLGEFNAMLKALPEELRGKIGGVVEVAKITDEEQMAKFFAQRVARMDEVLEQHLRLEYQERINDLLATYKPKKTPGGVLKTRIGDAQQVVNDIRAMTKMDDAAVAGEIASLEAKINGGLSPEEEAAAHQRQSLLQMFGNLENRGAAELASAHQFLKTTIAQGRATWGAIEEARLVGQRANGEAIRVSLGPSSPAMAAARKDKLDRWKGAAASMYNFGQFMHDIFPGLPFVQSWVDRSRDADMGIQDFMIDVDKRFSDLVRQFAGNSVIKGGAALEALNDRTIAVPGGKASKMEAIQYLLSWAQADAQERMVRDGWTDTDIETLRRETDDPLSQAISQFLRKEYDAAYNKINAVYKRMYGMDLPRITNYAPLRYEHSGLPEDVAPFGSPTSISGSTPTFVHARVKHSASLKQMDALTVYMQHMQQAAHFIHYAELVREMRGTLNDGKVKEAIGSNMGPYQADTINKWMDIIARGGTAKATEQLIMKDATAYLTKGTAIGALAFNIKSAVSQLDSAFRWMYEIPPRAWLPAFLKPGWLASVPQVWGSNAIQRRIHDGMNPISQHLMNTQNLTPSRLLQLTRLGMAPLRYTDAAGTTISSAIVFKYHYDQLIKSGTSVEEATEQAAVLMDRAVHKFSQPTSLTSKSIVENTQTGVAKAGLLFMSDPRMKTALLMEAFGDIRRGNVEMGIGKIVAGMAMGALTLFAANLFRDWASDDDDEDIWTLAGFLNAISFGQFHGVFIAGNMIDYIGTSGLAKLTGEKLPYYGARGDILTETYKRAERVLKDPTQLWSDDPEELIKTWENVLRVMGIFAPPVAQLAGLTNVAKTALGVSENLEKTE